MKNNAELIKRRRELARRAIKGEIVSNVADDMAEDYNAEAATIKNDWYNNKEDWIEDVFNVEFGDDLIKQVFRQADNCRRELWDVVDNADSDGDKIRALKELRKQNKELVKIAQSVGSVDEAPEKLEISIGELPK